MAHPKILYNSEAQEGEIEKMPYQNLQSLAGVNHGQIEIQNIVSSSPRKYACHCKRCKTEFNMTHAALRQRLDSNTPIPCPNDNCRLPRAAQQAREKQYFQDLKQKERAANEAAEDRRLREKYGVRSEPPAPPKPSLEQLDSQFQRTASELARAEKQRIQSGLPDPEFVPDPRYDNAKMTNSEASEFNDRQCQIFMDRNPDWQAYQTSANVDILLDYIWNQGVRIISAESYARAFRRLLQYNLLQPIEPEIEAEPEPMPSMEHEGYPAPTRRPQLIDGWDLQTGEPRKYTPYELDRLPAETLRRVLRIPTAPIVRPRNT